MVRANVEPRDYLETAGFDLVCTLQFLTLYKGEAGAWHCYFETREPTRLVTVENLFCHFIDVNVTEDFPYFDVFACELHSTITYKVYPEWRKTARQKKGEMEYLLNTCSDESQVMLTNFNMWISHRPIIEAFYNLKQKASKFAEFIFFPTIRKPSNHGKNGEHV